jgi:phosphoenolpyruvate-protein phosphotransferase/dihydroxyacetone kinase phosphotransfer subunit
VVGLVIVSHSARLAEGVVELAREMGGDEVPIEAAGGLDDPEGAIGTDAMRVLAAIERAGAAGDGALVLMDLGSAVLSAETALDFLPDDQRERVLLCEAPLVEGAVAAAAAARAGGSLEEVAEEARRGLAGKQAHLGGPDGGEAPTEAPDDPGDWLSVTTIVGGAHGLHARPAAAVVRTVAGLDAEVRLENVTTGRGPARGRSLTALSTLGALRGHEVRILARGPDAPAALEAVAAIVSEREDGAGSPPAAPSEVPATAAAPPPAPGEELRGVPASPGRAAGPARPARRTVAAVAEAPAGPPGEERAALGAALEAVRTELHAARDAGAGRAEAETAEILDAQAMLLDDEDLVGAAEGAIAGGQSAAAAWDGAVRSAAESYQGLDDEYLRARAGDLLEMGRRVLDRLAGAAPSGPGEPGILVADELGAAAAATLDPEIVVGIATAGGGPTSHASIIARTLGVPAVAGLGPGVLEIGDGVPLLLDGDTGVLVVDPGAETAERFAASRREDERREAAARERAHEPAVTLDGRHVEVAANIGGPDDAAEAVARGADGVGLLRTEFLFLDRATAPDEEEQLRAYGEITALMEGRRTVLRTLDAGADKPLAFARLAPEENPFLGVRGLRLSLARPELLVTQLRAVLRAAGVAPLSVMFPMVSEVGELRAAMALLEQARASLADDGLPAGPVELGVMIEVPAAALRAGALAAEVDFLSIGTNDLVQYTMAAERGNGGVARLSDPLHPAVLRLIEGVVAAARPHACRVAVCGEAASDPQAVPLLVGLGVDELSVGPRRVPLVKAWVRELDSAAAGELARSALELEDAAAVRALAAAS